MVQGETYHNIAETLMHMITEYGPPVLDKIMGVWVISGRGSGLCLRIELN